MENKNAILFQESVKALHWLLETVGEVEWAKRISSHLDGRISGFQSYFGGMGSFSDLIISKDNSHKIDEDKTPLANILLSNLRSIAYATTDSRDLYINQFLYNDRSITLHGQRCLDCGYGQISKTQALYFSAKKELSKQILISVKNHSLFSDIQEKWNNFDASKEILELSPEIEKSGLCISNDSHPLKSCPKCESKNTRVYRWEFNGKKYVPSSDNVPLKKT